jgi:LysR family transcriptional regulator, glycine cleavage system transcriptional activator
MTLPPLGALRSFEAAARLLSFKAAAAELHVTPTAISHQIKLLEEHLALRLFERHTRQVTLTAAGLQLLPFVRQGFEAFTRGVDALRPSARAITISSTMAFTARWLVPRVASFRGKYALHFLATDHALDLNAGTADIAVRYGVPPWPGLRDELLVRDRFLVVASPRLKLRKAADLWRSTLIHFAWTKTRPDTPLWPLWFARAGLELRAKRELHFSDETHAIQAALAGEGAALMSEVVVTEELRAGTLVQPFGPVLAGEAYHLVYPERAAEDARIAAVRTWLAREARKFTRAARADRRA